MAFCANCGGEVAEQAPMCPACGHPRRPTGVAVAGVRRTDGGAVASLVLGIAGFIMCPLIPHIVAIPLGISARKRIAADPGLDGEGMAKAGVIMGAAGVGLA